MGKKIMNCYNCGAPLSSGKCGYCGTLNMDFSKYILPSMDPKMKKHSEDCGGNPILLASRDPVSLDHLYQFECAKCKKRTKIYRVDGVDLNYYMGDVLHAVNLAFDDFENCVFEE